MRSVYLLLSMLLLWAVTIAIGIVIYRSDYKKMYSFLNMFPFEMKQRDNTVLNLIFRIMLTLSVSMTSVNALYLLGFNDYSSFLTKFLCGTMIATAFILISLFIINFRSVNAHIDASMIFFTFLLVDYVLFGYITLRKTYDIYYLAQTILAFVGAGVILIMMIYVPVSSWYKNKKVEKKGEVTYQRGKVNSLALVEWIHILLYILLYILIGVSYF